ncbi:MAG: LysR family transcriptional regulator [Myxococcota bacterium]
MDRLDAMQTFVAVAELRGFAQAARRLRVSPSAVTRSVAALEEHLSIRLLHRTTRRVSLTQEGTRYLERARQILLEIDDAERAARSQAAAPSGRFVVAAPSSFGRREVAPLFSDFLRRHPAVRGELTLADRLIDLVEEGVDAAVRIGVLKDSSLRVRAVGATRRILVASPKYLAAHKKLRSPRDLTEHATIQFTSLSPLPEWRFLRRGQDLRVEIQPCLVTNSAEAAIAHAERGGGIAMVLSYQASEQLRSGALRVVLPAFEPPPLPIQVVHPGGRLPSANVRAFLEAILARRDWSFVDL